MHCHCLTLTVMSESETELGVALEAARKRIRIGARTLSVAKAAERAGVSRSTWINYERGWQSLGGQRLPVKAVPATVISMARAVGINPEDALALAGLDAHTHSIRTATDRDWKDALLLLESWADGEPGRLDVVEQVKAVAPV